MRRKNCRASDSPGSPEVSGARAACTTAIKAHTSMVAAAAIGNEPAEVADLKPEIL
jgi:hypothetical protein